MANTKMVFFNNINFGNLEHTFEFFIKQLHFENEYHGYLIKHHNDLVFISIIVSSTEFLTLQIDFGSNNSNFL